MFPQKTLLIYVLISLQTIHIKGTHSDLLLQIKLKNHFNYDILKRHMPGHVLVWKITSDPEMLVLQDYREGFRTFRTDETYLLLAKKSVHKAMVHYWIGNASSLDDKKLVAKYALTLFTLIHEYYSKEVRTIILGLPVPTYRVFVSREQESLVSESFKHTINLIKGTVQINDGAFGPHPRIVDTQFLSNLPNLYVLTGNETSISIKKIPIAIGLKWLPRNDTCFILETAYDVAELLPITIFCGANTSLWLRDITFEIIEEFERAYFTLTRNAYVLNLTYRDIKWKEMLEVLENKHFYKFYDADDSNDHLKSVNELINDRSNEMSIFRISNQGLWELVSSTNIHSNLFHNKDCYIFNSASAAGWFLIFGKKTDVNEKVVAAQIMEDYIHRMIPSFPIPTPIRITNGLNCPFIDGESNFDDYHFIDLLINFNDWPIRRNLPHQ